jgi:hypothetical protein
MDAAVVFRELRYNVRIEECVEQGGCAGLVHAGPYSILLALHFDKGTAWMGHVTGRDDGRILQPSQSWHLGRHVGGNGMPKRPSERQ